MEQLYGLYADGKEVERGTDFRALFDKTSGIGARPHYTVQPIEPAQVERETRDDLLTGLELAEGFISGFEDDETQTNVPWMLATIRAAIGKARGGA